MLTSRTFVTGSRLVRGCTAQPFAGIVPFLHANVSAGTVALPKLTPFKSKWSPRDLCAKMDENGRHGPSHLVTDVRVEQSGAFLGLSTFFFYFFFL